MLFGIFGLDLIKIMCRISRKGAIGNMANNGNSHKLGFVGLSWDERNPASYIYCPSGLIDKLKKQRSRLKRKNNIDKKTKRRNK